jgi:rhamnulose-1-phosphate aldolase/alcohol dehydrogenase
MSTESGTFRFVNYLWDIAKASTITSPLEQLLYRSNLLGADLRITNFGGGNTSCKTTETDPLTGESKQVLWIKGSGGDLGSLRRKDLAGLYLDRLHQLKKRYRGLPYEDEMVALLYHCLFDLNSKAPSIDTPLHAFLPYPHIDHLHPDSVIALAASKNGPAIVDEAFEGKLAWIPWQRPGFDLGLKLEECACKNPALKGIVLGGHGLFTWGQSAAECYRSSLEVIEQASRYIDRKLGKSGKVFGGSAVSAKISDKKVELIAAIAPVIRGLCSSKRTMVGHFTDEDRVVEFVNSKDLARLAALGTSCPDHFLRTKIRPLVLQLPENISLSDPAVARRALLPQVEDYRAMYVRYYEGNKQPGSPPMRDANPVVILWPGVGMFTFAKDKSTARIAAEFYVNAINVMRGAEAVSEYVALSEREAFNIEYWQLEEDKLRRLPPEKVLTGRGAFVTGSAGGIGRAIAEKFMSEGACVVVCDNDTERLKNAEAELSKNYTRDQFFCTPVDVSSEQSIHSAMQRAALAFGGVDIVVNNAGISISRSLTEHSEEEWDRLQDILVKGQFLVSKAAAKVMIAQGFGGDIINIASKNAVVAGPKNVGYGSAKAAQLHMSRLLASELGEHKIRVNAVNPDAVIADSKIWQSGWAEDRAKAYAVRPEDLPKFYADRTLLREVLYPADVANGVYAFVSGLLNKSTGNVLNVDGGLPAAFPR